MTCRPAKLARLLGQLAPGCEAAAGQVEVVALRNAGGLDCDGLAKARQALLDEARGEFISYADDDDQVTAGFVPVLLAAVCAAIGSDPAADFVACPQAYSHADIPGAWQLVITGLQHRGWHDSADAMVRDITHINPVRASIARQVGWTAGAGFEDRRFTDGLRAALAGSAQVTVRDVLYRYRHDPADSVQYGTARGGAGPAAGVFPARHPRAPAPASIVTEGLPAPPGPWFRWHPDSA